MSPAESSRSPSRSQRARVLTGELHGGLRSGPGPSSRPGPRPDGPLQRDSPGRPARIRLARNVLVGPHVQSYAGFHPLDARERIMGPEPAAPIAFEENAWLGGGVSGGVILSSGVTISANTTLGAGRVVTNDVRAGVLAAGNPCRVIRQLQ